MKKVFIYSTLIIVIVILIIFNVTTVHRVSKRPEPIKPPVLNESPVRIYGVVEPATREIVVSPGEPGVVRDLNVTEGDTVQGGQILCILEDDIQLAELEAARARVAVGRAEAMLSRDRYSRNQALLEDGSISESQYIQLKLKMELDEQRIALYEKELALAYARFDNKKVAAPVDGIVYLCDIREGEFFGPNEEPRIILGSPELQVRCDVEVIWIGRLSEDATYTVLNAETGDPLGTAEYRRSSPYLRSKRLDTEDPQERMSARYQEVIMDLHPYDDNIPIRLPVMVELD